MDKKLMNIFIILLPFIDLITSLTTRLFNFSISLGIIIKSLFLLYMLYYISFKTFSKYKKIGLFYIAFIFIYIIGYFVTKINYITLGNIKNELTYIVKLIYYPTLLPSLCCFFDDFKYSKKEISNLMLINLILYTIFLIIPLITKSGFDSYPNRLGGTIGWFYSANELSAILIMLFPFIYKVLNKNKFFVILPFIIILTISTIGTKASMIGLLIDSLILLIISLFSKKNKNRNWLFIILASLIFSFNIFVFYNSKSFSNLKTSIDIQEQENINEEKEDLEDLLKELESNNNSKLNKFMDKYGKAILSDRDIYFKITYLLYRKNYNINTLLFGVGYTNNKAINSKAIEKLIEIDPLDIYFHSGLIAIIIILLPFIYYLFKFIKNKKLNINIFFYTLMLGMIFCVSFISGHTLMAPAVSFYIVLYLILGYIELGFMNFDETKKIKKGKVSIYSLHLNFGGIERDICNKANILSKIYDVEIISVYKLNKEPFFKVDDKVSIKYLTNVIPNKLEFKEALKTKNIFKILKEGFYSLKVLNIKDKVIKKSLRDCNSEIIISTRIDFSKKLIKYNDYNNIKVCHEHIYHNNNKKYFKDLKKLLKKIDYLMPSSNYLASTYKNMYTNYNYKIVTNEMLVETNNKISDLKNKNIISVGRLSKEKGFEDLIKLFSNIAKKHPDWILNIVGDGQLFNELNNLVISLGMENNIKLLGYKTSDELNKLYEESSIYINTSFEESFGLVALEAMSHGLPILAYSSAKGIEEIVLKNGIIISNRNQNNMEKALDELINDIDLRSKYQKLSLDNYKNFDPKLIEKRNIEFYKNLKHNDIFNNIYTGSKKEFYNEIETRLKNKKKTFIVTANPETYMLSEKDIEINNIINNKENYIIPDGIAVVKLANYYGYEIKERITGVDLSLHLLNLANKNKYKVYLYGSKEEVINKLEEVINKKYPNIKLVGATNGYIKDIDGVMNYILTTKPDIVLIALGIPKQEKIINKYIKSFDKGIFVGVGGSFDVLSGSKKRAPSIFIKFNLEWLYRIMLEPKRIGRFIKYNVRFLIKEILEKKSR